MRLGGPVFVDSDDPEVVARAHRELGYRAAYTPRGLRTGDSDRIRAVREAFARHDVVIAETGVWNNLMDPDDEKRKANLQAVTEGLALADELGARCCVNIAGGLNSEFWAGPNVRNFSAAAFDLAVENARAIIDAVKPKATKFSYEMMPHMVPDSADRYLALIEAIGRPAFAVHLDAVNIINTPYRYYDVSAAIQECLEKLGRYVVSCHVKDIRMEDDITVRLSEVPVGSGGFDLLLYLKGIAALPQHPPAMLEHLQSAEDYRKARDYVFSIGRRAGISFDG